MSGADGGYVRNPFEELATIVALESERNRCMVIGEDLGSVPDGLRAIDCSSANYRDTGDKDLPTSSQLERLARVSVAQGYLNTVNRILGEERDWKSDSHLLNATWSVSEPLKLQGFVYALEFSNSAVNSTKTTGVKASGKVWASLIQLAYNATYAKQSDYGINPANFEVDY